MRGLGRQLSDAHFLAIELRHPPALMSLRDRVEADWWVGVGRPAQYRQTAMQRQVISALQGISPSLWSLRRPLLETLP